MRDDDNYHGYQEFLRTLLILDPDLAFTWTSMAGEAPADEREDLKQKATETMNAVRYFSAQIDDSYIRRSFQIRLAELKHISSI